jgi:hypothetical protein
MHCAMTAELRSRILHATASRGLDHESFLSNQLTACHPRLARTMMAGYPYLNFPQDRSILRLADEVVPL